MLENARPRRNPWRRRRASRAARTVGDRCVAVRGVQGVHRLRLPGAWLLAGLALLGAAGVVVVLIQTPQNWGNTVRVPYISQEDTTKLTVTGDSSRVVRRRKCSEPNQFKEPAVHRRGAGDRLSPQACPRNMQTGYEAAGGADGLLRPANAWHAGDA